MDVTSFCFRNLLFRSDKQICYLNENKSLISRKENNETFLEKLINRILFFNFVILFFFFIRNVKEVLYLESNRYQPSIEGLLTYKLITFKRKI